MKELDAIKEQSRKKIELVGEYVDNWLYVVENAKMVNKNEIIFIDCMCNSGIYKNNDKGTAIVVLERFIKHAKEHYGIKYELHLNDNDKEKIIFLKNVIKNIERPSNVFVYYSNEDVNVYLDSLKKTTKFGKAFTLIFVDPFNFGTVDINRFCSLLNVTYCEILFNFFTSDIRRNIHNEHAPNKMQKIKASLSDFMSTNYTNDRECLNCFIQSLKKCRYIKYTFSIEFRNKNNQNLYYLVYATPNINGLNKLKESIWKVFKGAPYHINKKDDKKLSLFDLDESKQMLEEYYLSNYLPDVIEDCRLKFKNSIFTYDDIQEFIMEETMLKSGQIIKHVIKPSLKNGMLTYDSKSGKSFKKSTYKWEGLDGCK